MTTRRDLLTGTVAVITAPLLPIPAFATPSRDRLVTLAEEYFRLVAIANTKETDDDLNAAGDAVSLVRERMLALPADAIDGVVAKLLAARVAGLSDEDMSGRFALAALDDLERLAETMMPRLHDLATEAEKISN